MVPLKRAFPAGGSIGFAARPVRRFPWTITDNERGRRAFRFTFPWRNRVFDYPRPLRSNPARRIEWPSGSTRKRPAVTAVEACVWDPPMRRVEAPRAISEDATLHPNRKYLDRARGLFPGARRRRRNVMIEFNFHGPLDGRLDAVTWEKVDPAANEANWGSSSARKTPVI